MDRLPLEILALMLRAVRDYRPALRAVCRTWAAMLADCKSRLTLVVLAETEQFKLLSWVFRIAPPSESTVETLMICAARAGAWHSMQIIKNQDAKKRDAKKQAAEKQAAEKQAAVEWLNDAMMAAAVNGHEAPIRLCIAWGATGIDLVMRLAAGNGNMPLLKLCVRLGAGDFDRAMCDAAFGGKTDAMRYCKKRGATSFNLALCNASHQNHHLAMWLCKNWGATHFRTAYGVYARSASPATRALLAQWMAAQELGQT